MLQKEIALSSRSFRGELEEIDRCVQQGLYDDALQRLNACKNVLAGSVNAVASIVFVLTTSIDWKVVGVIAVGSTIGGQLGARYGRRLDPRVLRALIVCVGVTALIRLL